MWRIDKVAEPLKVVNEPDLVVLWCGAHEGGGWRGIPMKDRLPDAVYGALPELVEVHPTPLKFGTDAAGRNA
jgi:hypothetical protein